MGDRIITSEGFDHGEIETLKVDSYEASLSVKADLVISKENFDDFKTELEELISKYAL